ncbi:hypothetical protein HBB16_07795 [Pseudonocardia sp. MCCB 268]|nr:hypothetical protein [Pseudonocardia cytotoxica]
MLGHHRGHVVLLPGAFVSEDGLRAAGRVQQRRPRVLRPGPRRLRPRRRRCPVLRYLADHRPGSVLHRADVQDSPPRCGRASCPRRAGRSAAKHVPESILVRVPAAKRFSSAGAKFAGDGSCSALPRNIAAFVASPEPRAQVPWGPAAAAGVRRDLTPLPARHR